MIHTMPNYVEPMRSNPTLELTKRISGLQHNTGIAANIGQLPHRASLTGRPIRGVSKSLQTCCISYDAVLKEVYHATLMTVSQLRPARTSGTGVSSELTPDP